MSLSTSTTIDRKIRILSGTYLGQGCDDPTSQQTVADSGHNAIAMTCLCKHLHAGTLRIAYKLQPYFGSSPHATNDRSR